MRKKRRMHILPVGVVLKLRQNTGGGTHKQERVYDRKRDKQYIRAQVKNFSNTCLPFREHRTVPVPSQRERSLNVLHNFKEKIMQTNINARIEYKTDFWQLTLPCGDKITVSGIDAKVPQVCPKCKKLFAHMSVTRVQKPVAVEPQRVRC